MAGGITKYARRRSSMFRAPLVLLLLVLALPGCSKARDPWAGARPGQKRVLASFPPLYCMAHAVAGEDAYVRCLLGERGPHDFVDSPEDMLTVNRADLMLSNGL